MIPHTELMTGYFPFVRIITMRFQYVCFFFTLCFRYFDELVYVYRTITMSSYLSWVLLTWINFIHNLMPIISPSGTTLLCVIFITKLVRHSFSDFFPRIFILS